MPEEIKRELLAIADALDGLLRWEAELSGGGFPAVKVGEVVRASVSPAALEAVTASAPGAARATPTAAPELPPPAAAPRGHVATAPHPALRGEEASPTRGPATARPVSAPPALHVLQAQAASCTACGLHAGRTTSVFARGNPQAELVFVGEGPGYHEDQAGVPFVGQAGQLLDKMIVAMGYGRDDVYICNVVKCRPPGNRKPEPDEMTACLPYLHEQLATVSPKVIVALGATAAHGLFGAPTSITRARGQWKLYRSKIPVMPTFHPAYLLRQPEAKREVWQDLRAVMERLGKKRG